VPPYVGGGGEEGERVIYMNTGVVECMGEEINMGERW